MKRLTRTEYGLVMAYAASRRSEDPNTRVGCVIEDAAGRLIAHGYNGFKAGFDYQSSGLPWEEKNDLAIHAEDNALSLITRNDNPTIAYVTHSPCGGCARLLAGYGIKKVYYLHEYPKCDKYKKVFEHYGVEYEQIPLNIQLTVGETAV